MSASISRQGIRLDYLVLWSNGRVMLSFGSFARPPFDDETIRQGWLDRLVAIQGIRLSSDALTKWPTLLLRELADEQRLAEFLVVMDWLADRLRAM